MKELQHRLFSANFEKFLRFLPKHPQENTFVPFRHCVKVSKYGVYFGPHFLAFGLNRERYSVSLLIQPECGKMQTRKKSIFGHFSRSEFFMRFYNTSPLTLRQLPSRNSTKTTIIWRSKQTKTLYNQWFETVLWNSLSEKNLNIHWKTRADLENFERKGGGGGGGTKSFVTG